MKLYVMRPVMIPVPIVWAAKVRAGLKPAKRKLPEWKKRRREAAKRLEEYFKDFPAVPVFEFKPADMADHPNGTVKFMRWKPLRQWQQN